MFIVKYIQNVRNTRLDTELYTIATNSSTTRSFEYHTIENVKYVAQSEETVNQDILTDSDRFHGY